MLKINTRFLKYMKKVFQNVNCLAFCVFVKSNTGAFTAS